VSAIGDRLAARFPAGSFGRRLLLVSGGAAVGQAITILVAPILTRLYGPDDLGLLAVYASIIAMIGVVCSLAYQVAIPAAEDDGEAANLLAISVAGTIATSVVAGALSFFLGARIAAWTSSPQMARFIWMVPLGVLGVGLFEALSQWAVRTRHFDTIATTSVTRSAAQAGIQVGAGLGGIGAPGLLFAQLTGQWVGLLSLLRGAWRSSAPALRSVSLRGARAAASKHRRYPMFTLPSSVINAVDANAAPLLLSFFLGSTVTGLFALGYRILSVPFWLVGSSSQKVFYAQAVEAKQAGRLPDETLSIFGRLLALVLPTMAVLAIAGPELFSFIFGSEWREAGVYVQWLSFRTTFTLVVFPLTPLLFVLERQGAGTIFSAIQLVIRVGALAIGGSLGDARLAMALLGVGTGVAWLAYLIFLMAISGNRAWRVLAVAGREAAMAMPAVAPVAIVRIIGASDLFVTVGAAASGLVAVGALAYRGLARRRPARSTSEMRTDSK
jgi:O-antigen/teichoic acid export membrane protein